jgi:hypothetical protein
MEAYCRHRRNSNEKRKRLAAALNNDETVMGFPVNNTNTCNRTIRSSPSVASDGNTAMESGEKEIDQKLPEDIFLQQLRPSCTLPVVVLRETHGASSNKEPIATESVNHHYHQEDTNKVPSERSKRSSSSTGRLKTAAKATVSNIFALIQELEEEHYASLMTTPKNSESSIDVPLLDDSLEDDDDDASADDSDDSSISSSDSLSGGTETVHSAASRRSQVSSSITVGTSTIVFFHDDDDDDDDPADGVSIIPYAVTTAAVAAALSSNAAHCPISRKRAPTTAAAARLSSPCWRANHQASSGSLFQENLAWKEFVRTSSDEIATGPLAENLVEV